MHNISTLGNRVNYRSNNLSTLNLSIGMKFPNNVSKNILNAFTMPEGGRPDRVRPNTIEISFSKDHCDYHIPRLLEICLKEITRIWNSE